MSKKALFYTINGSLRCLSAPPPLPSPPFQAIESPGTGAKTKKKI